MRTQKRCLQWFGSDATVSEQYAALLEEPKSAAEADFAVPRRSADEQIAALQQWKADPILENAR